MSKAIELTANITYFNINDIISAKDAILEAIKNDSEISRPESLVDALFTQLYTKVKHLTGRKLFAENTARKYLDKLSDMGVLEKRIMQGNSYYLNLELYRILSK